MFNAKGMSMAIQIFIVLFVLLAVAMLVLRMVTEQTEQQIKIIGEEQRKQELKQIKADCQSMCKCGSLREKAGYCLQLVNSPSYGIGKMDFTEDGFVDDYAEPAETGGLYGLCEDKIYCSQINACNCGTQELSMRNCFQLICQLWKAEDPSAVESNMKRFFPLVPNCDMDNDQAAHHWSFVYAQKMTCA